VPDVLILILWAIGGIGVGFLLGVWQSRTIKKFEKSAPEKLISRAYLQSIPRILIIAGILFLSIRMNIWYGIAFATAFTISRWVWAMIALKKLKSGKE